MTHQQDRDELVADSIERLRIIWLALHAPQTQDLAWAHAAMAVQLGDIIENLKEAERRLAG